MAHEEEKRVQEHLAAPIFSRFDKFPVPRLLSKKQEGKNFSKIDVVGEVNGNVRSVQI